MWGRRRLAQQTVGCVCSSFIQFVPNIADQISKSAPWAVYGVFLIALMYLAPNGIMGIINRRRRST